MVTPAPHHQLKLAANRAPIARRAARRAGAFTLVELLVVIAIIGVLVSLLIPAVQAARESARRTQCGNKLRQIGIGLASHHAQHTRYPIGCQDKVARRLSWLAELLPYVEQSAVHEQIDLTQSYMHANNRAAGEIVLSAYLCPATNRLGVGRVGYTTGDRNNNGAYNAGDQLAVADYGGINGWALTAPANNGVMLYDRAVSTAHIRDGASNTMIVGEDTGRGWSWDGEWINGENIFDLIGPINQQQNNELWSDHSGGCYVLFCDGSVHFLSSTTDTTILQALATRAGQEPISAGTIP